MINYWNALVKEQCQWIHGSLELRCVLNHDHEGVHMASHDNVRVAWHKGRLTSKHKWNVGDKAVDTSGYKPVDIVITAIGEYNMLVKRDSVTGNGEYCVRKDAAYIEPRKDSYVLKSYSQNGMIKWAPSNTCTQIAEGATTFIVNGATYCRICGLPKRDAQ